MKAPWTARIRTQILNIKLGINYRLPVQIHREGTSYTGAKVWNALRMWSSRGGTDHSLDSAWRTLSESIDWTILWKKVLCDWLTNLKDVEMKNFWLDFSDWPEFLWQWYQVVGNGQHCRSCWMRSSAARSPGTVWSGGPWCGLLEARTAPRTTVKCPAARMWTAEWHC